jgi:hypothetical protein
MEPVSGIGERIMKIIWHYHTNKNAFSIKLGLSGNSIISRVTMDPKLGISLELATKILTAFEEISPDWFILGKGPMLRDSKAPDPFSYNIKYYHGFGEDPIDSMRVWGYDDCTHAFDIVGEMMFPKFRSADIVICKEVVLSMTNIEFGEAYLIFITSSRTPMIRYIKNSQEEGKVKIVAENARYEDAVILISDINKAYIIKGVIRREVY